MLKRLETKLNKIADIFKKPVIHKNGVSSLILPNLLKYTSTFIIHLVRDKRKVRDSILRVREERTGSKMNWWSIVLRLGKQLETKSPKEQVEWQINAINEAMKPQANCFRSDFYECIMKISCKINFEIERIMNGYHEYSEIIDTSSYTVNQR